MTDWKKWFNQFGAKAVAEDIGILHAQNASAEEMYQVFKARLIEELNVESNGLDGAAHWLADASLPLPRN